MPGNPAAREGTETGSEDYARFSRSHASSVVRTRYTRSAHRAPRRQYVISLAGGISITASDGETRHIGAGEIVLVEDTTGKGHITKSSGAKPRHTIFVPID